jgi:hypothetical protein
MCKSLKDIIIDKNNNWQALRNKDGKTIKAQETFRMQHFIGKPKNNFLT